MLRALQLIHAKLKQDFYSLPFPAARLMGVIISNRP